MKIAVDRQNKLESFTKGLGRSQWTDKINWNRFQKDWNRLPKWLGREG